VPKKTLPDNLRCVIVDFDFRQPKSAGIDVTVRFTYDRGKPELVVVFDVEAGEQIHIINNRDGRYKACITHAAEIVRLLQRKKPATEFAKQRTKAAAKPELKLVHDEYFDRIAKRNA
jgi:hypothetical protein